MLKDGRKVLIQSLDELPRFAGAKEVFLDLETTGVPGVEKSSLSPYIGGRPCGIAITVDKCDDAYYIPVAHTMERWNLPLTPVVRWLEDIFEQAELFTNQNVKFDAHFLAELSPVLAKRLSGIRMFDTMSMAKLIDSDRLTYNLTDLCKAFCNIDISMYERELKDWLKAAKSKNYADVPADIMFKYAAVDVLATRELKRREEELRPSEIKFSWNLEHDLTPVLYDMERVGAYLDYRETQRRSLHALYQMLQAEEKLEQRLGFNINPASNKQCEDALCNGFGLPVLAYTDKGDASFTVDALEHYLEHPQVHGNEELTSIIKGVLQYREYATMQSTYYEPFIRFGKRDGVLHADINQIVRTGRMSARTPNLMGLSGAAKELIIPPSGCGIIGFDYSQIEFRIIAHYLGNKAVIDSYLKDPWTDYHQLVADLCGAKRYDAKQLNFALGYGAGQTKAVSMLSSSPELRVKVLERVDADIAAERITPSERSIALNAGVTQAGKETFKQYHAMLPELKKTTRFASAVATRKGFICNAYGRRRHLGFKFAHKAFNNVCQSTAAELMKERLRALAPRYNPQIREWQLQPFAVVHDEIAFYGPELAVVDLGVRRYLATTLESPSATLSVPIRVDGKWSLKSWGDAGKDGQGFRMS